MREIYTLYFQAVIVVGVNTGIWINEIIYDFKVVPVSLPLYILLYSSTSN